jgi:peptidyl-prolyl cis-trans isomerase D
MLNSLRKSASGIVAKILLLLLCVSFGVWGIADIFRGYGSTTLASVGSSQIQVEEYRTALNTEIQRVSQQIGRPISMNDARGIGLDQRVLGQLLAEATLDARARSLGLAISDDTIAKAVTSDPSFQGPDGRFDPNRFDLVLRQSGYNEARFIIEQRRFMLRREIIDGLTGGVTPPTALLQAAHRYQSETRAIAYVVLAPAIVGELPAPDDAALQKVYEERKAAFRTPERRTIEVLPVTAATLSARETVSDADVQARYERDKAQYTTPERRTVQRITFPTMDEAKAAAERIAAGTSFEDIAKERKLSDADISLGTETKAGIVDHKIADAAFALEQGKVSAPVAGDFGPALVRVTAIIPEVIKPLDAVKADISKSIAAERARNKALDLHDQIEDARAGGATLAEVAKKFDLPLAKLDGVDHQGLGASGKPADPDLPERDRVLAAAFQSDVGIDNEPVQVGNDGYVWYDVTNVDRARDRTFEEAKDDVTARWRADEMRRRLVQKSDDMVKSLSDGSATLSNIALQNGLELKTADAVSRVKPTAGFDRAAVAKVFATAEGGFGAANASDDPNRVVFQVTGVTVPPFDPAGPEGKQLDQQLAQTIENDLATEYVLQLQNEIGTHVNQQAVASVVGNTPAGGE